MHEVIWLNFAFQLAGQSIVGLSVPHSRVKLIEISLNVWLACRKQELASLNQHIKYFDMMHISPSFPCNELAVILFKSKSGIRQI